jgi:site-specific DNA-methyltransferase (adenine-specific)
MIFSRWDVQQQFIDKMNANGLKVKNVIVWDKEIHGMGDLTGSYASRYETILFHSEKMFRFQGKRPQDIVKQRRVLPKNLQHPNEKPVELLEQLITKCCKPGGGCFG